NRGCPAISRISSAPVCPRAPTMPTVFFPLSAMVASSTRKAVEQVALHRGPFGFDDRERHRVAHAAIGMAAVAAQDAILPGAQPQDGRTRAFVERAGFEAHADAAQCFECMPEQEQLGLGVDPGSLRA